MKHVEFFRDLFMSCQNFIFNTLKWLVILRLLIHSIKDSDSIYIYYLIYLSKCNMWEFFWAELAVAYASKKPPISTLFGQ